MKTRLGIWIILIGVIAASAGWIAMRDLREGDPLSQKPAQLTADGTLLLGGRPFFPIGIYQVNHTDAEYALLAENGFNAVQGNFATEVERFLQTLDLAQRHHLAVAVPLHAENLVKENLDKSLAKIRAAADHPAVLSWKICDEPDSDTFARLRSEVPPAYRAIKDLNPGQPVQLTLCKDATLGKWTRFCDLVEIDRYPVPGKPLTQVFDFCKRTHRAMEPWQNLTCVVQCGWTRDLKTQPTFAQARSMVYLALIGGAKGIFGTRGRKRTAGISPPRRSGRGSGKSTPRSRRSPRQSCLVWTCPASAAPRAACISPADATWTNCTCSRPIPATRPPMRSSPCPSRFMRSPRGSRAAVSRS